VDLANFLDYKNWEINNKEFTMSVYLVKRLRRKNNFIEHNIEGTNIWCEIDEEINKSLENKDFRSWKDGTSAWILNSLDGYEYCLVNLKD